VRRILLVLLIIPAVLGLTALPAHALTFTVDSTADDDDGTCLNSPLGDCTLREAINEANDTLLPDTINFNISGPGQHTIAVTGSPLPNITDPVTIDGFSDPDDAGRIELDGTNAGAGQLGLVVSGGGNGTTIRGLVINDFGEGIRLSVGGNTVQGNYIGTDETGLVAESNLVGMFVSGSGNQIGGTGAGQGNVISGNDNDGVGLPGASNTVLEGNYIGLKADGSAALANGNQGVHIHGTSTNNTIGGTSAAARNVISGNSASGVAISSATNTGNIIRGNYIGTKPNGTEALPNNTGVRIIAGSSNTIGGTAAGAGNVISGNSSWGVSVARISDPGPSDITVQGNLIGTTASGNAALGNGSDGINIFDASNTVIGGGAAGARNVISGNGQDGIDISGIDADGTQVKGNTIGLGSDGSTDVGNTVNGILVSQTGLSGFLTGTAIGGTGAGEGNVISGNAGDGIMIGISRVQNTSIQGNIVGLASDGATDRGNDGDGIDAEAVGTTTVGGTTAAARNVVSGNGAIGMFLKGTATYVVQGNFIGMDAIGTTAVPNGGGGAIVSGILSTIGGTTGVTVGGNCTGACNLISGNTGTGLVTGSNQTIRGNYIGTDVTGLLDRGNTGNGIGSGTDNTVTTIGGTAPEARNIVSGNNSFGMNWGDVGASNDLIQGNYVGVGSDGTTAIGNSNPGITLGGDGNTIGGTAAGAGNVIAFNGGSVPGVQLIASASGNSIRGNSIHSNGGLGIDLDPIGSVNPNDADDVDTGANEGQNFPLLATAEVTAGAVTVTGTLNSVPSSSFSLDFYSNPGCNAAAPNDHGEGRTYLGELTPVTTNAGGDATFTFTSDGSPAVSAGEVITATATDAAGNTSEFSRCRVALGTTSPTISIADTSVTEGDAGTTTATFTVSLSAPSPDTVTVDWATADGTATSPADYEADSGTVTFAPTDTSETIDVTVNGDLIDEGTGETFQVNLSNAGGATIADGQGIGTITDDDTATISIDDVAVVEGNSGTTPATFTVSLSTESASTVTVDWATADGTATSPGDYAADSGTVTFVAGDVSEDVVVDVNGDTIDEANETFTVDLSNPVGATIADGQGIGTITDDDTATISIDDVAVVEGNSGTTPATFTVSLSSQSASTVTVDWATADETATEPGDYVADSDTVTFAPGDVEEPVVVDVNGDTLDEANETFTVDLSNAGGASIADGQGIGTITDDDTATISIDDVSVPEGDSGTTPATFTVSLSSQSASTVTVDWATADETATEPGDYVADSDTVTFAPGDVEEPVVVDVNGDTLDEANETFTVDLSNAGGASIADGQGIGTISDDDPTPSISIGDVTVTEGNAGTVTASFPVSLSSQSGGAVTVDYATANGTAAAPSDYESTMGTLMFPATETSGQIDVTVNGDVLDEPKETFFVNLSAPSGATIGDGQGLGTITDDDAPPAAPICPGFETDPRPQLVGTAGPDVLVGTGAAEILCGLNGNDVLKGGGGKDLILGGGGNDRLAGQGGKDVLKGQAGKDRMNGGPGVDRCQGGPGRDVARACEKGRA
jgi:CSLREA domain-containing protein